MKRMPAAEAVGGVSAVIFTGGADISPSLYYRPQEWHGIPEEQDYDAERDVSDYLTMSYCLDNGIPVLGVENTRLAVTAYTATGAGEIPVIEAVERIDKDIAFGIQFHPEAAAVKHMDDAENKGEYMDYETALALFRWLVEQVSLPAEDAA